MRCWCPNRRVGSSPVSRTIYLLCSHLSCARVVELADSLDSGSSVLYGRAGSSPASRTKKKDRLLPVFLFGPWGCEEAAFLRGPRADPTERFAWGKEPQRSERAFADRQKRGIRSLRRRRPASRTKAACLPVLESDGIGQIVSEENGQS